MNRHVWIECTECKGTSFRIERNVHYTGTWLEEIKRQYLCHDGYGWELDTFDYICEKCKSKNSQHITWEGIKEDE